MRADEHPELPDQEQPAPPGKVGDRLHQRTAGEAAGPASTAPPGARDIATRSLDPARRRADGHGPAGGADQGLHAMLTGRDGMALAVLALVAAVAAPAALGAPTIGVPRADCGPGSRPEPALQGEVTKADRENGRSAKPYTCNLEVVGNYPGEGADYQDAWYGHCAYYDTKFQGGQSSPGVQVLDVADPQH